MPPIIDRYTTKYVDKLFSRLQKEIPRQRSWCIIFAKDHAPVYGDGEEHTLYHVSWVRLLNWVEDEIKKASPEDKRTEAWERVMRDMPKKKKQPDWVGAPIDPNKIPKTEYSVTRGPVEKRKSNVELIDALAAAAKLNDGPSRQKDWLRGDITYWDGCGDSKRPCSLMGGAGNYVVVRGGRLGRDHTFEDVPNHFCRDQIMFYINEVVPEKERAAVRHAVFTDLTNEESAKYAFLVQQNYDKGKAKQVEEDHPEYLVVDTIEQPRPPISFATARNLGLQEAALDDIDENIDLTPKPGCGFHDDDRFDYISKSVMKPGEAKQLVPERNLKVPYGMDYDCDQVRALIKLFMKGGVWTLDHFRQALCNRIERAPLTKFLQQRGERAGNRTMVYHLAWEFFKRRELLGLPLTSSSSKDWGDMSLPPAPSSASLGPVTLPSLSPTPEESEEESELIKEQERLYEIRQDPGNLSRTYREAAMVAAQQDALESIDVDDVDLIPNSHATRYHAARVARSVIRPGTRIKSPQAQLPEEEELVVPDVIDLDCDQVRVMIKRFLQEEVGWSLDTFRQALGSKGHEIDRKKISMFLQGNGPEDGHAMLVYQLAWEFFKRRDLLGLPIPTSRQREADVVDVTPTRRSGRRGRTIDYADTAPRKQSRLSI